MNKQSGCAGRLALAVDERQRVRVPPAAGDELAVDGQDRADEVQGGAHHD